jgi:choline dehydrogenase-like flavoprotein
MSHEPVDILIIGAGASGAAFAWSLSETKMDILCLEQGDWKDPKKYPSNLSDYELYRWDTAFSSDPNERKLPEDYPINSKDSPITPLNFNAVGGGTINYMGVWPRFHPSDFKVKTLDGVADDWPVDYELLEPYYALNDRMMGVSGLSGNPAYPPYSVPLPPLPIGKISHILAKAYNQLGWHWWLQDTTILSKDYEGRAKCVNAGPCDLGCASGAKASTDITYWPRAIHQGVRLKTRCRVREITIDSKGMADGVLYYDEDDQLQEQKASVVVLACNGIGTPRILLNSTSNMFPNGLANRSGLVGKNLMFHPLGVVVGRFDDHMEAFKGPFANGLSSHEFYETDPNRDFVRGYALASARGFGPLTSALGGYGGNDPLPWGELHRQNMDYMYDSIIGLSVVSEDLPEECNRVTIDHQLKDSDGIPAVKVTYRQSENNKRMINHGKARAREVLETAGAGMIMEKDLLKKAGWHLLGTARMGTDPERSVVNSWGRSHDVKNLFIVDGSVFVTAGGVNPTSTIQAIALYIGDQIKKKRGNLFE